LKIIKYVLIVDFQAWIVFAEIFLYNVVDNFKILYTRCIAKSNILKSHVYINMDRMDTEKKKKRRRRRKKKKKKGGPTYYEIVKEK
jgi:hypothetical protein